MSDDLTAATVYAVASKIQHGFPASSVQIMDDAVIVVVANPITAAHWQALDGSLTVGSREVALHVTTLGDEAVSA